MKCNRCGQEFGKGNICQHCGADKVAALGEFSGYSAPKKRATKKSQQMIDNQAAAPSPQHVEPPISTQICWKCGEIIPLGNYCPVCGQELFRICPNCKTKYSSQYHICPNCGTDHREYEKAIALEHERQRKQQEAQKEEERRKALKQKKLDDYHSYDFCALEVSQLIKLRWVSKKQREELAPLLKSLREEIRSLMSTPFDWQTDLTRVEGAWRALYYSPVLIAIKKEKRQREEAERIAKRQREEAERIAREAKEKERIEREKQEQQANASWERRERYVSNEQASNEGCSTVIAFVAVWLGCSMTIFLLSCLLFQERLERIFNDEEGYWVIFLIMAIAFLAARVIMFIKKTNLEEKRARTEHFYFWRNYPKQVDEIEITEIKGKNAIITFDKIVKYQPQHASIRVMRGTSFTIKSNSSSFNEIDIVDDYPNLNPDTKIGINTITGTLNRSKTSAVWRGRAFDIKFEAVNNMFISQIDVTFDAVVVEKQKPSMELVQEVVMGIISKVMETHEFSLESTIGGDLNACEEERMDICLRINNAFNLQLTKDRITESMTVLDLCLLIFNSDKQ